MPVSSRGHSSSFDAKLNAVLLVMTLLVMSGALLYFYFQTREDIFVSPEGSLWENYYTASVSENSDRALIYYAFALQDFRADPSSDTAQKLQARLFPAYIESVLNAPLGNPEKLSPMLLDLDGVAREFHALQKQASSQLLLAEVYLHMGDYMAAEALMTEVLDSPRAHFAAKFKAQLLYAQLRLFQSRPLEALKLLNNEAFASLDPNSESASQMNLIAAASVFLLDTDSSRVFNFIDAISDTYHAREKSLLKDLYVNVFHASAASQSCDDGDAYRASALSWKSLWLLRLRGEIAFSQAQNSADPNAFFQNKFFMCANSDYRTCTTIYRRYAEHSGKKIAALYFAYKGMLKTLEFSQKKFTVDSDLQNMMKGYSEFETMSKSVQVK